jgi:hypothetical protein
MKRKSGQSQPSKRRRSAEAAAQDAVVIREGPGFTQVTLPPGQVCNSSDMQPARTAAGNSACETCMLLVGLARPLEMLCDAGPAVWSQGVVASGCAVLEVVSGCVHVFG